MSAESSSPLLSHVKKRLAPFDGVQLDEEDSKHVEKVTELATIMDQLWSSLRKAREE